MTSALRDTRLPEASVPLEIVRACSTVAMKMHNVSSAKKRPGQMLIVILFRGCLVLQKLQYVPPAKAKHERQDTIFLRCNDSTVRSDEAFRSEAVRICIVICIMGQSPVII